MAADEIYTLKGEDFSGLQQQVIGELDEASREGLMFNVPCDSTILGALVFTEGGEFDRAQVIRVEEVYPSAGTAFCLSRVTDTLRLIPVANLRDPHEFREEAVRRFTARLAELALQATNRQN